MEIEQGRVAVLRTIVRRNIPIMMGEGLGYRQRWWPLNGVRGFASLLEWKVVLGWRVPDTKP